MFHQLGCCLFLVLALVKYGGAYSSKPNSHCAIQPRHPFSSLSARKSDHTQHTKPPKIIIAGAPAAGKGTQCEVIKSKFGVVHLSTGDIIRKAMKESTELGLKTKEYMDKGCLVPDSLIIDVVRTRLRDEDCASRGWLLDGFPRTIVQADALVESGMTPDCFILLDVPEEVLVERVTGRRMDPVTGAIYHLKFNPPSPEIVPRLIQRSDDTAEKIITRFKEFQSHISAVLSRFSDKLIKIDGTLPQDKVSESVVSSLSQWFSTNTISASSSSWATTDSLRAF